MSVYVATLVGACNKENRAVGVCLHVYLERDFLTLEGIVYRWNTMGKYLSLLHIDSIYVTSAHKVNMTDAGAKSYDVSLVKFPCVEELSI
ncbi:hypothetical protein E2C01_025628 [Portunus trituberculatus]|uniref:Uncharacterized protein n=1 Tax=Portunus trituberculatus TaxID=210409 RepID=A0A5B7EFT0_PORTR|nr:hypothetical protein [Portunus trituberculatus]